MNLIRILLVGDIVGISGCAMFAKHISTIREQYKIDGVIVNGENSSPDGRGITIKVMSFFKHHKVNVVTSGNHIWAKKEIYNYLSENKDLLRPANFPTEDPGVGYTTFNVRNYTIGVINLQARTFMRDFVSDPFKAADTILTYLTTKTKIILVDFHGEATSEKMGLAYYLDSRISALVGTHTHVPTADERVLPGGTAYITDLGMVGALNSMIGMKKETIIRGIITQMPVKFEVETEGPMFLSGAIVDIDVDTGKANKIQRIYVVDENLNVDKGTDE